MGGLSGVSTPHERLRALAATATIGTDRFGIDATAVTDLLIEAATCGLQARAGWRPRTYTDRLPACPPDDWPVAPAPAIGRLLILLAERDGDLIEEWADLALSHSMRVDGATVPLVLDWWARQPRRAHAVFAVLGRRGEWLASLNPGWRIHGAATGMSGDTEAVWQTGTSAERVALLTSVRRLEPARALALVEATWRSEGAAERQRFVEALFENASIADEPFLETALDDRSKVVRRLAAAVLARIEGSRLRHRLSTAARRFISAEPQRELIHDRPALVLMPPESFDPSWDRDGIEQRSPRGVGQRAWWMRQILANADLSLWTERTGLEPASILESLRDDDYSADAVGALVAAAQLTDDPPWSAALVRHLLKESTVDIDSIIRLLGRLPRADIEPLALDIAATESLLTIDRWTAIASIDRPWSSTFSRDAMTILSTGVSGAASDTWGASQLLDAASRRIAPEAIAAFERAATLSFPGVPPHVIARSIERVRFRAEMHKEFTA